MRSDLSLFRHVHHLTVSIGCSQIPPHRAASTTESGPAHAGTGA